MTGPVACTESSHPGRWWHTLPDGRIQCDLCPRDCRLHEGQRGACFVRRMTAGAMVLTTYGRSSGFCVDPIEKKPLNQFYPGTSVFSFGTAGCNLACKFCQNWDISRAHDMDRLMAEAGPARIAEVASELGCRSVAYTYNDPVIFAEYALDTAHACRERGLGNVAVSAGYLHAGPRAEFFALMDAANIDLKAFSEAFYVKYCGAHLQPVLDTLEYLVRETACWVEITTLVIPGLNDSDAEMHRLAEWIMAHLGPDVPLHFSAFHPDYKLRDLPATPPETLRRARRIAIETGLRYVYTGNVHDAEGDTNYCPGCQRALIVRDWYDIRAYAVGAAGECPHCGTRLAGRYQAFGKPFGARRIPVAMARTR